MTVPGIGYYDIICGRSSVSDCSAMVEVSLGCAVDTGRGIVASVTVVVWASFGAASVGDTDL